MSVVLPANQHCNLELERECLDLPYNVHHVLVPARLPGADQRADHTAETVDHEELRGCLAGGETVTELIESVQDGVGGKRADDVDVAQRLPFVPHRR